MADMKVTVKNFGPIGEAKDIRLSPMTLFVGPSNTGKSYLAVLLYAIVGMFKDDYINLSMTRNRANRNAVNIGSVIKRILESDAPMSAAEQKSAETFCKKMFARWAGAMHYELHRQLLYCFGQEGTVLFGAAGLSIVLCSDDGEVAVDFKSPERSKIGSRALSAIAVNVIAAVRKYPMIKSASDAEFTAKVMRFLLARGFYLALRGETLTDGYYLPAARGGIMQNHRGLVDAAMRGAPLAGWGDIPQPLFTGVHSDFMRKLISIPDEKHRPRTMGEITQVAARNEARSGIVAVEKELESRRVMDGEIQIIRNEAGYPSFYYKFSRGGKDCELSLQNASSMVSELAPVSIFIRYHLNVGNLFIVEEPEMNLHPNAQRGIADILVHLANAGVFVLATTHSDIVLEQISNAVHRAKLNGGEKSCARNGGASLSLEKAVAYAFAPNKKGKTTVKEVDFNGDTGFMTRDHLDASKELYNETISLLDGGDD